MHVVQEGFSRKFHSDDREIVTQNNVQLVLRNTIGKNENVTFVRVCLCVGERGGWG